jgi:hypothetical protein
MRRCNPPRVKNCLPATWTPPPRCVGASCFAYAPYACCVYSKDKQGHLAVIARTVAILLLLLPGVAEAQFRLDVTQIALGSPQEDDPAYPSACARDACRAAIPLLLGDDLCVLNVQIGAPSSDGWGQIWLALGPCRSSRVRVISNGLSSAKYHLDRFGVASMVLELSIQPRQWRGIEGLDDGVRRADAAVRLDIIATDTH